MNGFATIEKYVVRAEMLNDVLSFTIGPSRFNRLVSRPTDMHPWKLCMSPSLVRMSTTDEVLPL